MTRSSIGNRREQGTALLVTVFVLLLVGAIAVAGIEHSGQEAASAGRTRAAMRALSAADAGFELAVNRINERPPNLALFDINLPGGWNVQSRARADAAPQPIALAGTGLPSEGYSLPSGGGVGYFTDVYLVNVTSSSQNGSVAEIEAKLARLDVGGGGY